jgi:3-deoxy-D-manno-octulosonate 8-phosphate phosphatase (KDO 8-P phosphatase)
MVIDFKLKTEYQHLKSKIEKIKLVITDNDGVLTDTGVYYSAKGEEFKRYSIRDGMGVERLRKHAGIETVIITGESSGSVKARAEKLQLKEYYLGVKDKVKILEKIKHKNNLIEENIAFIGDDVNDIEIMKLVGLTATPADGTVFIKDFAHFICKSNGGNGAFRDFAELIIAFNTKIK